MNLFLPDLLFNSSEAWILASLKSIENVDVDAHELEKILGIIDVTQHNLDYCTFDSYAVSWFNRESYHVHMWTARYLFRTSVPKYPLHIGTNLLYFGLKMIFTEKGRLFRYSQ